MAVIDVVTYNGEAELFDLRYNILKTYVDEFVVVEATSSFSGLPKELFFEKIRDKYKNVTYYVNTDDYSEEEIAQARESDNTKGIRRWMHEFLQKERIKKAITHLKDDDIVFVGDVDEIVDPLFYENPPNKLTKFKLRVYTYYLNLRSTEQFWGTICARYGDIKNECLNHLRNNGDKNTLEDCGWHFTSQGGLEAVKKKVFDQYNPDAFGNAMWNNLESRFGKEDYIGRDFKFTVDESEWPKYLKEHKDKYKHLCQPNSLETHIQKQTI